MFHLLQNLIFFKFISIKDLAILNEKPKIEIFYCNIPSQLIVELNNEQSLASFPIANMYDCLNQLHAQLNHIGEKNTNYPDVTKKFGDKDAFINAVYADEMHENEQNYLKGFFLLIHNDLYNKIDEFSQPVSYEKMDKAVNIVLRKFFTMMIKICSLRYLYSTLTIQWTTDMNGLNYSFVLPTYGVCVDDQLKQVLCHVFWDESLKEYCFRLAHNLDAYKSTHLNNLEGLYAKGDKDLLRKRFTQSHNESIILAESCFIQSESKNSLEVETTLLKGNTANLDGVDVSNDQNLCQNLIFLVTLCLLILILFIAIFVIIIY